MVISWGFSGSEILNVQLFRQFLVSPPAHQRVAAQTSTGKKSHNKLFNWFTWRRDIKSPLVVCVSVYEVVYKVL